MGALIFEVVHGPSLIVLGRVRLVDVSTLSASTPIQGYVSKHDKIYKCFSQDISRWFKNDHWP